jgi:hypothetical protein
MAGTSSADLILITVDRKNSTERVLLGTTAEQVSRECTIPVFLIPASMAVEQQKSRTQKNRTDSLKKRRETI